MTTLTNAEGRASILIGIDPGSTIGVAIRFRKTDKLTVHQFTCLYEAMQHLDQFCQAQTKAGETIHFLIEDARLVKGNRFFAQKNNGSKDQGVGSVKGQCSQWERFCKFLNLSYEMKAPRNTKMDEVMFEKITGIKTLRTHTHCRDAALMVL